MSDQNNDIIVTRKPKDKTSFGAKIAGYLGIAFLSLSAPAAPAGTTNSAPKNTTTEVPRAKSQNAESPKANEQNSTIDKLNINLSDEQKEALRSETSNNLLNEEQKQAGMDELTRLIQNGASPEEISRFLQEQSVQQNKK